MTGIGNKAIFAKNLVYYIEKSGRSKKEVAEAVGVAASTFNEWTKGKKYPRIDKIEILANFFGVLKSDLIEEKTTEHRNMQKKNDVLSDIILKINTDEELLNMVVKLTSLDAEKRKAVNSVLNAFSTVDK